MTKKRRTGWQASADKAEADVPAEGLATPFSGPSATILPIKQRRTYLTAAREQGVHQDHEELIAEYADLTNRVETSKRKLAALNGEETTEIMDIANHSKDAARFALETREAEIVERMRGVCQAYEDAGLGGTYFAQLCLLLFDTKVEGSAATAIFAGAKSDSSRNHDPEEQYERRRLNGEGLTGSRARPSQPTNQEHNHNDDSDQADSD